MNKLWMNIKLLMDLLFTSLREKELELLLLQLLQLINNQLMLQKEQDLMPELDHKD
jgi:hypothetical protein